MPNKKQLKWWSLATALVLTALTALTACTNDNETQDSKNTATDNGAVAALQEATGLSGNNISIPKNPGTAQRNADGSYNMTDFIIDMDLVKKTVVDEKTTYSFSIMPKVVTSMSDFNLIVYNNGNEWEYTIMEFIRKPETSGKFQGTVKELYSSVARGSGCNTIFIEFSHCTHTGDCASGTCDRCSLCVDYGSITFCRIEAEQYLSAELAENPDYGGSGGGTHTGPQHVVIPDDSYVFEPNIKNNVIVETRKERAINFFNALSTEQKRWAEAHPDSYSSLINYLLDHFTPDNELKIMDLVAMAAADDASLTIDESITADNAMVFNTVEDFQEFLDEQELTPSDEYEFDPSEMIASTKIRINFMLDLDIDVKQTLSPYHVESITSELNGMTLFNGWTQTSYAVTDMGDNVYVHIKGKTSLKLFVDGVGTFYEKKVNIELHIEKATGKIYVTILHPN